MIQIPTTIISMLAFIIGNYWTLKLKEKMINFCDIYCLRAENFFCLLPDNRIFQRCSGGKISSLRLLTRYSTSISLQTLSTLAFFYLMRPPTTILTYFKWEKGSILKYWISVKGFPDLTCVTQYIGNGEFIVRGTSLLYFYNLKYTSKLRRRLSEDFLTFAVQFF